MISSKLPMELFPLSGTPRSIPTASNYGMCSILFPVATVGRKGHILLSRNSLCI